MLYFENFNLSDVITPVNVPMLQKLLNDTEYDKSESEFLVKGFTEGFPLGYQGNRNVQQKAPNLKITIGSKTELWNKVMKEVQCKRYAGPFEEIPFQHYIQSPIGLVPKDNGKSTRLIFHLSYPRLNGTEQKSVNANTPKHLMTVAYPDLETAIRMCLKEGLGCLAGKSDLKSAFRNLGMKPQDWCLLVMKAESPIDHKIYYFVDKCMPFGAAISCSHFQRFSNALAHIVRVKSGKDTLNYLDDFFFVSIMKLICDKQIKLFIMICNLINFPISLDKTFWGETQIVFLGTLIDTTKQQIFMPIEKINKALEMISDFLSRKKSKVTLREIQQLCGLLNFFTRAIVPGRAFTRRLYALTSNKSCMKPNHHIKLKQENKLDLILWNQFLSHPAAFAWDFTDFTKCYTSEDIELYTDASGNPYLGVGGYCNSDWFVQKWDSTFIFRNEPSINYLELYGVACAVLLWISRFSNRKIALFCDNRSVVDMINKNTSKCKNCMVLIRIIVMEGLKHNVRIAAKHVLGTNNKISDCLSRMKFLEFHRITSGKSMNSQKTEIPEIIWPMEKIWLK